MKKKIVALCVVVCMLAVAVVSGTLAYFTDVKEKDNEFVLGDVEIEITEDFVDNSEILPDVEIEKIVSVTNTGISDAYTRVILTFPAHVNPVWSQYVGENGPWTIAKTESSDTQTVYTLHYADVIAKDVATYPCLEAVYIDEFATEEDFTGLVVDGKIKVNVKAEAIQAAGFANAEEALANLDIQGGVESGETEVITVANDEELASALADIKANSKYWNKSVVIKLKSNTYTADHVINQYPEWNGTVGAGGSGNNYATGVTNANYTRITLMPDNDQTVEFTGNVTVNGFGNAGTGFATAAGKGSTTFVNVTFDANTHTDDGSNKIAMYVKAAANDVTFRGCTFENATHITVGGNGSDAAGLVTFTGCSFNNGNNISGYVRTLNVENCTATDAYKGFINVQGASDVTVTGGTVAASEYFIRTNSQAIMNVTGTTIDVSIADNGEQYLVKSRGANCKATFTNCTIAPESIDSYGVSVADGTLVINN